MGKRWRWMLVATLCAFACSEEKKPPVCEIALPDESCAGVTQATICEESYCAAGATCVAKLHVDASAAAGGDGSAERPFERLEPAAAKATAGDCILLAAGSYGAASVKGGVSVLGKGAASVTITSSVAAPALLVSDGKGGLLRGFAIAGEGRGLAIQKVEGLRLEQLRVAGRGVGIDARAAFGLTFSNVHVKGTLGQSTASPDAGPVGDAGGKDASAKPDTSKPDASKPDAGPPDLPRSDAVSDAKPTPDARPADAGRDGAGWTPSGPKAYGIGLLLAERSTARVSRVAVEGSATQGILAHESAIELRDSLVRDSGFYGVAIDCSQGCKGLAGSSVTNAAIEKSGAIGLWARGSTLSVRSSRIGPVGYAHGFARGIDVGTGTVVEIEETTVKGSQGQGIVIDAATGTLARNRVEDNEERGIVIQRVTGALLLEGNELARNEAAGIGVTGSRNVTIKGGSVTDTRKRTVPFEATFAQVGDGLQILRLPEDKAAKTAAISSEVAVSGLRLENNGRLGVLIDGSKSTIADTTITGGEAQLVVQNAQVADQTFTNVKRADGGAISPDTPAKPYIANPAALISSLPVPIP